MKFLDAVAFQNRYQIQLPFTYYFGLIQAIPKNWKRQLKVIENTKIERLYDKWKDIPKPLSVTGWARLNRSLSSARFYFELSGNSNYIIHCKSNYVQNFELEINSI